ncbi:MAG: hypothetical protein ACO249_05625 [Candidatus Nanopelagicales bacterium]
MDSQIYKAPSIPKINRSNISSPLIRGSSSPKLGLRRSSFKFIKPLILKKSLIRSADIFGRKNADNLTQADSNKSQGIENALIETNKILVEIQNQLATDFALRIAEEKEKNKKIKAVESKKRFLSKEGAIESVKKIGTGLSNQVDKVLAPAKSIFEKIIEFFKIVLTGIIVNNVFKWLEKPENAKKLADFLGFLVGHWKEILLILGTIKLLGAIGKIITVIKTLQGLFGLLMANPIIAGTIIAGIIAGWTLAKLLKRDREERELNQQRYERAITGTNYDTSVSGKPAQIIPYRPSGAKNDNSNIFGLIKSGMGATFNTGGQVPGLLGSFKSIARRYADGGTVVPGTRKSSDTADNIPAMLSQDEFVVRAPSARIFKPILQDINENAGRLWEQFQKAVTKLMEVTSLQKINAEKFKEVLEDYNEFIQDQVQKIKLNENSGEGGGMGGGSSIPSRTSSASPSRKPSSISPPKINMGGSGGGGSMRMPTSKTTPIRSSSTRSSNIRPVTTSSTIPQVQRKRTPTVIPINLPTTKSDPPKLPTYPAQSTEVPSISSVNMSNMWMERTPQLYGIMV